MRQEENEQLKEEKKYLKFTDTVIINGGHSENYQDKEEK